MFDLDSWFMPVNRGNAQKEIEAIFLPYKCGKIEAVLIAERFFNHQAFAHYMYLQPSATPLL